MMAALVPMALMNKLVDKSDSEGKPAPPKKEEAPKVSKSKQVPCTICDAKFYSAFNRNRHMQTMHKTDKPSDKVPPTPSPKTDGINPFEAAFREAVAKQQSDHFKENEEKSSALKDALKMHIDEVAKALDIDETHPVEPVVDQESVSKAVDMEIDEVVKALDIVEAPAAKDKKVRQRKKTKILVIRQKPKVHKKELKPKVSPMKKKSDTKPDGCVAWRGSTVLYFCSMPCLKKQKIRRHMHDLVTYVAPLCKRCRMLNGFTFM